MPSNVTRITRAIKARSSDGIPQIVYYHFGVGSQGSIIDRVYGLAEIVREGYEFISTNYVPGDEIFLIGFSRGAFTARSIAGLIGEVGVLTKGGLPYLSEIFRDVQHMHDPNYVPKHRDVPFPNKPSAKDPRYKRELVRRGLTRREIPIKAIGVWDTVGSLGTPRIGWLEKLSIQSSASKEMSFYDTKLSNCIENAFQALALDESRASFSPAVWEKAPGNTTTLRQVWFPGVHSNVGGGYPDQQIGNITLAWMMSQLAPFIDFDPEYILDQDEENERYYEKKGAPVRPWSFGKIYDSMSGLFALGGSLIRTPGAYYEIDPWTGRKTSKPLRDTHEYIHPSVRTRFRLKGPGVNDEGRYEAKALNDWKLMIEYDAGSKKPDVFWKARSPKRNATTRILPESPLWDMERELLESDPETYEHVMYPPQQQARKKVRERPVDGEGFYDSRQPRVRERSTRNEGYYED
ncbi:hypothetical protein LTR66_002363 [Elasticomyces elasticus]|nr:hypothetical protein LTR66_002363 [Elasticomyces elasticus]